MDRRQWLVSAGAQVGGLCLASQLRAEDVRFNERTVEPQIHREDNGDIWTLHFNFKNPRILTADVPARGEKVIWYMWYQVYNRGSNDVYFYPDFELVTLDRNTVHPDEVLPSVQDIIQKREHPNNGRTLLNSVTIGKDPIPVTKVESYPRSVTGVAIWSDVYDRAKDTNRFSIFVTGLSNGWTMDEDKVIRRKTLQMNFQKPGDSNQSDVRWADSIKLVENPVWIYRVTAKAGKKN